MLFLYPSIIVVKVVSTDSSLSFLCRWCCCNTISYGFHKEKTDRQWERYRERQGKAEQRKTKGDKVRMPKKMKTYKSTAKCSSDREKQCSRRGKTTKKQGRIHGYPSRVRVGRGHIWGHLITWAGAVRPRTAKNKKRTVWRTDGPTDGWTDGRTKRGVESRSTRLKIKSHSIIYTPVFPPAIDFLPRKATRCILKLWISSP